MHSLLDQAVGDMTLEQLNYRPAEGGLSPFFSLWHYVRTEDNIVNFIAQGRPTVWLEGGYDQRFGLHRTSQGRRGREGPQCFNGLEGCASPPLLAGLRLFLGHVRRVRYAHGPDPALGELRSEVLNGVASPARHSARSIARGSRARRPPSSLASPCRPSFRATLGRCALDVRTVADVASFEKSNSILAHVMTASVIGGSPAGAG